MRDYPWLICEKDGEVIGYAYAHRFRTRPAYDWDAELSIYLDRSATGAGIGPALYSALLELLRLQNYVNVYGAVSIPNPPSERLHEKLGFERVAVFRRTGRKLGEWRDLAFYHIVLNDYAASPAEVIPFPALAPEAVLRACAEGAARLNK